MKIFLSHKFTGEDVEELKIKLGKIKNTLENSGHSVFCSITKKKYFQEQAWSKNYIYQYCLKKQENCDIILSFIHSEHKSLGMEKELKKAININQKIILAIPKQLNFSHFREKANKIIEYSELEQLCEEINKI